MSEILNHCTIVTQLTKMHCPSCGGLYAIAQEYLNEAYQRGGSKQMWACPYCKQTRGYGDGEIDQLKRESQALQRQVAAARERADFHEKSATHFRKSRDAVKGVVTKIKKRVGNGVCPCCQRSFSNLRAHMAHKHPKYKESST